MSTVELFLDCSGPWTYLAFHGIQPIVRESCPPEMGLLPHGPGGLGRFRGLEIGWPEAFPVNSVQAMRGCLVAGEMNAMQAFARRTFEAYWRDLEDISQPSVLEGIVQDVGLDAEHFRTRLGAAEIKTQLRDNTQEVMDRGGFGSTTLIVDQSDLYFGQDRLELVRAALLERRQ